MRSFFALALAGITSAAIVDNFDYEFVKYISVYGKRYATKEEFAHRLNLYKQAA
jgi:hypothetical protein